jgi:hypothetical protein
VPITLTQHLLRGRPVADDNVEIFVEFDAATGLFTVTVDGVGGDDAAGAIARAIGALGFAHGIASEAGSSDGLLAGDVARSVTPGLTCDDPGSQRVH